MKELGPLMDVHVHINDIHIHSESVANFFKKDVGDVRWKGVPIKKHVEHINRDHLDTIYAIYENPNTLIKLRQAAPECDIKGMLFVRDIKNPDVNKIRGLFQKGLVQGLKIHPVIDNFNLTTDNLTKILELAREFKVPVMYHSDDRKKYWRSTAPELQESLIKENPDVNFIIGHGGAYAHARLVSMSNPGIKAYWEGNGEIVSRRWLVKSALKLARLNDNAFYDLTVVANRIKAKIVADFVNAYPDVSEKILVGTDFPIHRARATSQVRALETAGLRPMHLQKIAKNRI